MSKEKERGCGSCGTVIADKTKRKGFNSLCKDCRIPHMSATNLGDGKYRCDYCGYIDRYENLFLIDCGKTSWPPCKDCGGTPYCDPDCSGISAILGDSKVHVVGFGSEH